jgi:hypothetical protein
VLRLQTVRHRTRIVRAADDRPVAEVVDDEVSVLEGVARNGSVVGRIADDADPAMARSSIC